MCIEDTGPSQKFQDHPGHSGTVGGYGESVWEFAWGEAVRCGRWCVLHV